MIKSLTSLRFCFAFLVFLSHLNVINDPEGSPFRKLYTGLFHEGYIGVSFFFILSGFILAYSYEERLKSRSVSLKEFWVARIARIYPLHLATLLIAIPMEAGFSIQSNFLVLLGQVTLTQSFIPLKEVYFSFNSPSWSISNEAFFYLLFPFLIFLKTRVLNYLFLGLLCILLGSIFFIPANGQHWFFYINPFTRIVDFILGILLFKVYRQVTFKSRIPGAHVREAFAIAVFLCFFAFRRHVPEVYRFSFYYWIPMALAILIFAYQQGFFSKLLSYKVFTVLGEISFAFYLVHQLVIRSVVSLNQQYSLVGNAFILSGGILLVTLALSYLLHFYLERPMNELVKRAFQKKRVNPGEVLIHAAPVAGTGAKDVA